mmetsp:Transcript_17960/g.33706  ORF Transcript_17960/g.33706 Transcript_17960/m.33706 type:complete len:243 (-) Transcript_17960:75-803(-)
MEIAIIQDHRTISSVAASKIHILDHNVLIQSQLQLRVSHQVRLHLDASVDGAVDDKAVRTHQNGYTLQDVHEDLILFVLRVMGWTDWPVHSVAWHCARVPLRQVEAKLGRFDYHGLVVDAGFQVLGVGSLGIPEINHLVKQLIHKHKVLPYALFVEHAAEVLKDLCHLRQKLYHGRRRDVVARRCNEVQPILLDEDVCDSVQIEDGGRVPMPEFDLSEENFCGALHDITTEVSRDDCVAAEG